MRGKTKTKIVRVKGDRKAQRILSRYADRGWVVQSHTTRKALFSLGLGLFTRAQIHTITFTKAEAAVAATPHTITST